jgi:hypothetical protein
MNRGSGAGDGRSARRRERASDRLASAEHHGGLSDRLLPAEPAVMDPHGRQFADAPGAQAPRRRVDGAVPRHVACSDKAFVERDPGGGGGLGENLGILEVESAAEREPARGEGELRSGQLLGRVHRRAQCRWGVGAQPLRPLEREALRGSHALGRFAGGGGMRRMTLAVQRHPGGGDPIDVAEAALDALRREIGKRAHEVEEERDLGSGCRTRAISEAVGKHDQFSHTRPNDPHPENWRKLPRCEEISSLDKENATN